MFDEELVRNQDDEFNLRLVRAGEKSGNRQRSRAGIIQGKRCVSYSANIFNMDTGKRVSCKNINFLRRFATLFLRVLFSSCSFFLLSLYTGDQLFGCGSVFWLCISL